MVTENVKELKGDGIRSKVANAGFASGGSVAATAKTIYFSACINEKATGMGKTIASPIYSVANEAGTTAPPKTLVPDQNCPQNLTLSASTLFFSTDAGESDMALFSVPTAGGTPKQLLVSPGISSLAADDKHLYFVAPEGIVRTHHDGSSPELVAKGKFDQMITDKENVYALDGKRVIAIKKT
jgi:hypothetical protein